MEETNGKKIIRLEAVIAENKVQIELDEKQIAGLQKDLNDLSGGFQVCKSSVINVLNKFNEMFPGYQVEGEIKAIE